MERFRIIVGDKLIYEATEKQTLFHACPADEVLYGGSAGGGKTLGLLMDAFSFCLEHAGVRAGLFRRTYPELRRTLVLEAIQRIPTAVAAFSPSTHELRLANGSVIEFNYCQREDEVTKFQSAEYQYLGFDETSLFTEFQVRYLLSRLRTSKEGVPLRARFASNPGNVGHLFLKRAFVDPAPPNTVFRDPVTGRTRCFIPARVWDNEHLMRADPGYVDRLKALPEAQRKALLEGSWDVFEGQYFSEWNPDKHVIKPFPLPEHWRRYRSVDYGYANPCAALWFAVDEEGRVYVYREMYAAFLRDEEQAKRIVELSGEERIEYTVGGHDFWSRQGSTGVSIADTYAEHGVVLTRADTDRIARWNRVRNYLADAPDGKPWLQIFSTCANLIRTLPAMVHDRRKPEDLDTDAEDHAVDALGFFLATRPEPAAPSRPGYASATEELIAREVERLSVPKREEGWY